MTGGAGGSHAIAKSMAWGRDAAPRACVMVAVQFVVTHVMTMETGSPVAYVRVKEGFVILG